jgi:hypothetical protein
VTAAAALTQGDEAWAAMQGLQHLAAADRTARQQAGGMHRVLSDTYVAHQERSKREASAERAFGRILGMDGGAAMELR